MRTVLRAAAVAALMLASGAGEVSAQAASVAPVAGEASMPAPGAGVSPAAVAAAAVPTPPSGAGSAPASTTVPDVGDGRVTLISNKNWLTHIMTAPKVVNHQALQQQQRALAAEEDAKKKDNEKIAQKKEQGEKALKQQEQSAKNAEEEKTKAAAQAELKLKMEEEKSKAEIKIKEESSKSDSALAKAKEEAEKADAKKKAEEEDQKKVEKEKEERRKRFEGARLTYVGYGPYGEPYSPAHVDRSESLCIVRGLVTRQSSDQIANLPQNCWPRDGRLIFNLFHGTDVRVDVLPDGRIYYIAGSIAASWLSLNGITFDSVATQGVQFYNNWRPYGSGYRNTVQSRFGDLCVLSGLISSGGWGALVQMRGDCNPSDGQLIFSCNNHASPTRVDVTSGGTVVYAGGSANHGWVSLDGIIYTPGSGGTDLSLYSGWGNYFSGWRPARYQRTGRVCAVSGLIRGSWAGYITQLPPNCRPSKRLIFNANVHTHSARVDVLPDGQVHYISNNGYYGWLSLSNIHFAVGGEGRDW